MFASQAHWDSVDSNDPPQLECSTDICCLFLFRVVVASCRRRVIVRALLSLYLVPYRPPTRWGGDDDGPRRKVRGETETPTKTATARITLGGRIITSGIIKIRGMEGGNKVAGDRPGGKDRGAKVAVGGDG